MILPKDAELASDQECDGDGRVDMTTADVYCHPDDRCNAEPKRQRNTDNVSATARATGDQYEEQCTDELSEQSQPEPH